MGVFSASPCERSVGGRRLRNASAFLGLAHATPAIAASLGWGRTVNGTARPPSFATHIAQSGVPARFTSHWWRRRAFKTGLDLMPEYESVKTLTMLEIRDLRGENS